MAGELLSLEAAKTQRMPESVSHPDALSFDFPESVELQVEEDAGFTNIVFPSTTFEIELDARVEDIGDIEDKDISFICSDSLIRVATDQATASWGLIDTPVNCSIGGIDNPGIHTWHINSPSDSGRIVGQVQGGQETGITRSGTAYLQVIEEVTSDLDFAQPFELTGGVVSVTNTSIDKTQDGVDVVTTVDNRAATSDLTVDVRLTITEQGNGQPHLEETVTGEVIPGQSSVDLQWQFGRDELPAGDYDVCGEVV